MKNTNLGSKMSNNKQNPDVEPVGANNIPETLKLNSEVEIDANGNETIVQRARNIAGTIPTIPQPTDKIQQEKEGLNRGVLSDKDTQKTIENKDHNSDIIPNRYPNSHPDNKENRGNMTLDE